VVVHFVGSHYISSSNRVTDARSVVVNWDYGVVIVEWDYGGVGVGVVIMVIVEIENGGRR
jgi:hypothetical protein